MRDFNGEFSYLLEERKLSSRVNSNGQITYLDNAATNQRPQSVIDAMDRFHTSYNANVHRGVHWMADTATEAMELSREQVRQFINAASTRNIVFTSGTTQSINMVAHGLKPRNVVLTNMEHHANIVPWHLNKCLPYVLTIDASGEIDLTQTVYELERAASTFSNFDGTQGIVAITHVSNVLGTINPIKEIIEQSHRYGFLTLIDGAQAVGHLHVDVQDLDCDFYAFSGHKMYGPMGVGILYGKEHLLEQMQPMMGGGEMISSVSMERTQFNDLPYKFEAGTPNVPGIIGLAAGIAFISNVGWEHLQKYESNLVDYCVGSLNSLGGFNILGPTSRGPVVSFTSDLIHSHDIAQILDQQGVAVRSGHHCAEPLHTALGISGSTRASFSIYNSVDDVDELIAGLQKVKSFFK